MHRQFSVAVIGFAIAGFLIGAAGIAESDENDDLREELRNLQREAARERLAELRDQAGGGLSLNAPAPRVPRVEDLQRR